MQWAVSHFPESAVILKKEIKTGTNEYSSTQVIIIRSKTLRFNSVPQNNYVKLINFVSQKV